RANLSPQAQAVKELLMSVISSPVMEKRQWQLGDAANLLI
ncbi:nitrogen assimilation transcriptional regulator, partial [Salmonella enterica]|nr:nitrogen assimilation transcriptional regulator [Salmonella enterica]